MFRHFYRRFKTHFELDRRQARIHMVLLWLTMLILCSPVFTYYTYPLLLPEKEYRIVIDTLVGDSDSSVVLPLQREDSVVFKKHIAQFSEQDWIAVGVPSYLAKRILKYQAKGAVLKDRNDLKKVYGMHEGILNKVIPFILEEKKTTPRLVQASRKPNVQDRERMDINRMDTTALMDLPGIGPVFARRIVQYRTLLKGYVRQEQYQEVYGLSAMALEVLQKNTFIKASAIAPLNAASYVQFNEHLYLSSKDARYLVQKIKEDASLCWDALKQGLEPKAQAHLEDLKVYYPCP